MTSFNYTTVNSEIEMKAAEGRWGTYSTGNSSSSAVQTLQMD